MDSRSERLIAQLNSRIPAGVDWKAGALNYLARLFQGDQRESMRRFHLVKPFMTLRDSEIPIREQAQEFTRELAFFAHLISILNVSPRARFLDVACGTGWVSHYLAKLGLRVYGFDISPDMIDLARERMAADPWPTTDGSQLNVDLCCHDIEAGPLSTSEQFDVAILESALHHFVNPIEALRNLRRNLKDDGVVIVIEGSSDGRDDYCREVMELYDTLERPYTPAELDEILMCAGFSSTLRLVPLSGFFHPGALSVRGVAELLCSDQSWNTVIAFNSASHHGGVVTLQGAAAPKSYIIDASGDIISDIHEEHWIGASSELVVCDYGASEVGLVFRSPRPNLTGRNQQLIITPKGAGGEVQRLELHPSFVGDAEAATILPLPGGSAAFNLQVSEVFSPSWTDKGGDKRLLGGRIALVPVQELQSTVAFSGESSWLPADGWIGPDSLLRPAIGPARSLTLRFTSHLPCVRKRPQTIVINILPAGEQISLELLPETGREASGEVLLSGLPDDCQLRIQSSDSFNPAWESSVDDRLLSVRIEEVA